MKKEELIKKINELIEVLEMTPQEYVDWHNNYFTHSDYRISKDDNTYACRTGHARASLHYICDLIKEIEC